MGLFDDLKKASTKVAGEMKTAATTLSQEAGKQGKVAQAQLKLRSLQGEVGEAERALGGKAFDLAERGEISHAELGAEMDAVRAARAAGGTAAPGTGSTDMPGTGSTDMPGTGSSS